MILWAKGRFTVPIPEIGNGNSDFHIELADLNLEAEALAAKILGNFEELWA